MGRPRETIDAAMFAPFIGVDRPVERHVRRLVAGDDLFSGFRRQRRSQRGNIRVQRRAPTVVDGDRFVGFEPSRPVADGAASLARCVGYLCVHGAGTVTHQIEQNKNFCAIKLLSSRICHSRRGGNFLQGDQSMGRVLPRIVLIHARDSRLRGNDGQKEVDPRAIKARAMNMSPTLSVIIPTLNAAQTLPGVLASIRGGADDVLVVDGGSSDDTVDIARVAGASVLSSDRGRGLQLQAGGETVTGDWLLFLHADTRLDPGWGDAVRDFMNQTGIGDRAAVFRFALDDPSTQARRMEHLVNWRSRVLGLPYGDQGLLISREHYDSLGGFRPMPLMEDVDIMRRIGKKNISILDTAAVTSAARYQRGGWWARPARNICCLILYFLGVPPRILEKIYR